MISKASFNPVTSRALQAAALKAEKSKAATLDIGDVKNKDKSAPAEP